MSKYEKVFIYFDTNAIECRHSGNSLFLSQFTVNQLYYDVEQYDHNYDLSESVEICIPEIVWYELKEHLINHFSTEKQSMEAKLASYKKSFGDLIDINCEFKDCNEIDEYKSHLNTIMTDFLKNPRVTAKIIPYPKDEDTLNGIVEQAIQSAKPFRTAKNGSKEYTDAGFKDALIFNTILQHTGEQLGILVSKDHDFSNVFTEYHLDNLHLCATAKEIEEVLDTNFKVNISKQMERILSENTYLIERILEESHIYEWDVNVFHKISACDETENDIKAEFLMSVDGVCYLFDILYNIEANELIQADCKPYVEETEV